ncbi:hypothetical protein [Roseovarius arcticus]|uniref:hypothetical protein n=1 Tax=Roseovarius arcticus TaxID=2547404 RepID=UPI001110B120|nr:hypothetical protein [Roseovarius arcticus]
MFKPIFLAALLAPGIAFAAGGGATTPPKPTETTQKCKGGQIWDNAAKKCKSPEHSQLSPDTLFAAAREFAYAEQYVNAQRALAAMPDQDEARVQTYMGFTTRKMGDVAAGMAYYKAALARDPGDILARSYIGQALVEGGDTVGAYRQLMAIRDYGGAGTWAEASLRSAIETGQTYSY